MHVNGRTSRIPGRAAAIGFLVVVAIAGYFAAQWVFRDPRPISTAKITSGTWAVVSIDDTQFHAPPALPTITMSVNGTATIETGCERIVAHWNFDSDGDAIGFRDIPVSPDSCPESSAEGDDLLRSALLGARTWVALSADSIEIHGADTIALRRQ